MHAYMDWDESIDKDNLHRRTTCQQTTFLPGAEHALDFASPTPGFVVQSQGCACARLHGAGADARDGVVAAVVRRAVQDLGDVDAGEGAHVTGAEHAEVGVHRQRARLEEVLWRGVGFALGYANAHIHHQFLYQRKSSQP